MTSLVRELDRLRELEETLATRFAILEQQAAVFGELNVPAHLEVERRQTEERLGDVRRQIAYLRRTSDAAPDPYLGLATFQERDADVYHGREALVELLVSRAAREPLLAVLGPSGSGKSSLVLAGLLPVLRRGAIAGSEHWRYLVIRPGARPLDTLAAGLAALAGDPTAVVRYGAALAESDRALLLLTDALLAAEPDARLLLVVDQCEELWTQAPADADSRRSFVETQQAPFIQLLLTATAAEGRVRVIATMRADFLHRAAEYHELARRVGDHLLIVSPMQPAELRRAVEQPAADAGGSFEPGLVDELVSQAEGRPGALPLLEYTLLELWRARRAGVMTWEAYRALGGVEGALARRADGILSEIYTPAMREELRAVLLRLVQPGEGAADTRRRVALASLAPAGGTIADVQALIKPMTDARLLTTGRDANGAETVEISHEALLRAWPAFAAWIDAARDDLRLQLQLEETAAEWAAGGASSDFLWRGLRLARADEWFARVQPRLTERDQQFLDASRAESSARAAAEEAARRERETLLEQAQQAAQQETIARRAAQAQAYAGEALFELARRNTDRAMLLAYGAVALDVEHPPPLALRALRQVYEEVPPSRRFNGHRSDVVGLAWHRAGQWLLSASEDGTAAVWDVTSGVRLLEVQHPRQVMSAAWRPGRDQFATACRDGVVRIWSLAADVTAVNVQAEYNLHTAGVQTLAWSPDGGQLLSAGRDDAAIVWDPDNNLHLYTLSEHSNWIMTVAWSPDGQHFVTAGEDRTARVWDAATGAIELIIRGFQHAIRAVAWSPDGRTIALGGETAHVQLWDVATGLPVGSLEGHSDWVHEIAWSPDASRILTASGDQSARIWDAATGAPLQVIEGHTGFVTAIAWSPDGQSVATGGSDRSIRLRDLRIPAARRLLVGHQRDVMAVALVGERALTGDVSGELRIWDAADGRQLEQRALGDDNHITTPPTTVSTIASTVRHMNDEESVGRFKIVAFRPDGHGALLAGRDGTAWLVTLDNSSEPHRLTGHTRNINAASWSPDGALVATGSYDGTVRIWRADSGAMQAVLDDHHGPIWAVDWCPVAHAPGEYDLLSASSDASVRLWRVASGECLRTFAELGEAVRAAAWSPDGEWIVTGNRNGLVQIWSATDTTKPVIELRGHADEVRVIAWSPDGQRIATGSRDRTTRLWDATTGALRETLDGHTDWVHSLAWSADSRQLLSGSRDSTARIWLADHRLMCAEVEQRLHQLYSDDEIREQLPT